MKQRRMNENILEIVDENKALILSIEEMMEEDVLKIKLTGEIRNEVAHDFEDEIMAALSVCDKIEVDFAEVTYIASMALKSLLSVQQMIDEMENAGMILKYVRGSVMETFKESGFSEILMIEEA